MSAALENPPAPTFHHLGEPAWWTCPHCRQHVLLYPALGNNHRCPDGHTYNAHASVRVFHYYYELSEDNRIRCLVLVGAIEDDPLLKVTTLERGRMVEWERKSTADGLKFYPPDPETACEAGMWYDDRLQRHEPIPRRELERRALRGRHTA